MVKIGAVDSEITREDGLLKKEYIKKKTLAEHIARGAGMPRGLNK